MKRFAFYFVLTVVCSFLGYELYKLNSESVEAQKEFDKLNAEKELLVKDSDRLNEEIEYFKEPRNLEKELRARFNVRLPYEKLIIVVPQGQETGDQ